MACSSKSRMQMHDVNYKMQTGIVKWIHPKFFFFSEVKMQLLAGVSFRRSKHITLVFYNPRAKHLECSKTLP